MLPDGEYRKGKHNASTARESNSPIVTCASQMHPPSLVPQGKTGTTVIGKRGVNILGAACIRSIIATLQHGQGPTAPPPRSSRWVFKSGPSSKWNTHTHCYSFTIPLRTSTVCIYVHVLRIHCGGCDRTVLYTALFCVVWVPPLPILNS